jgi:hypothetical protein
LSIPIADLEKQNSELMLLKDNVNILVDVRRWKITASLQQETVKGMILEYKAFNLILNVKPVDQ